MKSLSYSRNNWDVFRDFLEMSQIALANTVYGKTPQGQEMEARYMEIIKGYKKEELEMFSQMLAIASMALSARHQDFLGEVFMSNDFGNAYRGQFFTPYHISQLMTMMTVSNMDDIIKTKGYFSMNEPTCGSGGMVIATHESVLNANYDPATTFWAQAQDIDPLCYKMCYIQLSLLDIPAVVILGNTLALEVKEFLYTPAFVVGDWHERLEKDKQENKPANIVAWGPEQLCVFKNGTLF